MRLRRPQLRGRARAGSIAILAGGLLPLGAMRVHGQKPPDVPTQALTRLRQRVDAHFATALARTPAEFRCRPGCDACCHQRFGVFELEARPIRAALAALDPNLRARVRAQADDPAAAHHCPLLVDGRCAVYDARPLICRTHGLPIAVTTEGGTHVDHCPLNFADRLPPRESVLVLDALNQPLVVAARMHDPNAARIPLEMLAREL